MDSQGKVFKKKEGFFYREKEKRLAAAARPVTIVASSLVESLLSHLLINGHSASTLLLRALELHTKDLCELLSTCDNLKCV